jgi:WD40 repeat protein
MTTRKLLTPPGRRENRCLGLNALLWWLGLLVTFYYHWPSRAYGQGTPDILWTTNAHIPWQPGGYDGALSVAFSPDSALLASGGGPADRQVKVWSVMGGALVRILTNAVDRVDSLVFSPDGQRLAATGGGYVPFHSLINLWETSGWTWRGVTNVGWAFQLAFSHDGKYLAAAHGYCGECYGDVAIFQMPSGDVLTRYGQNITGYGSLAFSADDRELATSYFGALSTQIRNATNGAVRISLQLSGPVAFSPDGGTLMVADYSGIVLVNAATGSIITNLVPPWALGTATFTPDGKAIVSWTGDDKIRFWRLDSSSVFQTYDRETTKVWALAVAPNGRYFAYGRDDGVVVMARMPLWITDIIRTNNQVRLSWSGGTGLYQLLQSTNVASGVWQALGEPTTNTTATVGTTNTLEFFRVQSLPEP